MRGAVAGQRAAEHQQAGGIEQAGCAADQGVEPGDGLARSAGSVGSAECPPLAADPVSAPARNRSASAGRIAAWAQATVASSRSTGVLAAWIASAAAERAPAKSPTERSMRERSTRAA